MLFIQQGFSCFNNHSAPQEGQFLSLLSYISFLNWKKMQFSDYHAWGLPNLLLTLSVIITNVTNVLHLYHSFHVNHYFSAFPLFPKGFLFAWLLHWLFKGKMWPIPRIWLIPPLIIYILIFLPSDRYHTYSSYISWITYKKKQCVKNHDLQTSNFHMQLNYKTTKYLPE